jgi:glucose/arabinose dehydrogenase
MPLLALLIVAGASAGFAATIVEAQSQAETNGGTGGGSGLPFPLRTLPGFHISLVSNQIRGARFLAVAPNGDVIVTQIRQGRVLAIPPGAPADSTPAVVAEGLPLPNGVAFRGNDLYIATWSGVSVVRNYSRAVRGGVETLFSDMPHNGDHNARAVALASDGTIFISSGSDCNICTERDPRLATIMRYEANGSGGRIYASGLRNASGLAFDRDGRLWAVVNQRDNLVPDHTNLPPDELDLIREGGNYGWPDCYPIDDRRVPNPEFPNTSCAQYLPTAFNFQAHSAPLGVAFYHANQFPSSYSGNLFVAFHGSWNRTPPTGYKVVAVSFTNGHPTSVRDFVTGWLTADNRVLGRPVGLAVGVDGSLYISDDTGYLFKVTYGP